MTCGHKGEGIFNLTSLPQIAYSDLITTDDYNNVNQEGQFNVPALLKINFQQGNN